ncbi:hypothetical protein GCT19_23685 [Paraburkholderia sp. CNPSo 3155]|uniref:Uncharacterized protein n=1 Tax=Paraburkholderia atlantica TaxID=2654982 RepID=A0A6I1Q2T5_PARAM|nr:hypothetical protein [Paraburkholderia atlantica]MBB5423111.1 hypothetical protein [Paraburkholderia atlantica]MPW08628.1 hypothetical protein [Paraburkholderia atlantica]
MLEVPENLVVRVYKKLLFLHHFVPVSPEPALGGVMTLRETAQVLARRPDAIHISAFAVDRSVSKDRSFVDRSVFLNIGRVRLFRSVPTPDTSDRYPTNDGSTSKVAIQGAGD